ncbi:MAG: PepSY domain-containing protein [Azonexus sp.]|jgi:hypothetical protein|nr:PepSY domain-containing protein [Azonexus sp.]
MKKFATLFVSVALAGACAAAAAETRQGADLPPTPRVIDKAPAEAGQRVDWLPIPQLIERLAARGYHDVGRIEIERGRYEVYATNPAGDRVSLYLDPKTGEQIERKRRNTN